MRWNRRTTTVLAVSSWLVLSVTAIVVAAWPEHSAQPTQQGPRLQPVTTTTPDTNHPQCPDWYAQHPNWDNEHGDMPCGTEHSQPPCVPSAKVSCGPGFGPGAPVWTTPTPRTWATPTPSFTPAHPGQQIVDNRVDIPGFIAAMNRNGFRVSDEAATVDSGERACARRASESEDQVARSMYVSSPGVFANLDRARVALSIIERYLCPAYRTEG